MKSLFMIQPALIAILITLIAAAPMAEGASTSDDIQLLKRTSRAFTDVAQKAVPAVVSVQVEKVVTNSDSYLGSPYQDDFFDFFFGPRYRRQSPRRQQRQTGQGSGFVISDDGYVLTNHHVVGDADKITIIMSNGNEYDDVKLIGSDEKADVALLKIQDVKGLPVIELGDSDSLDIGEWVIAVGNPFGLTETVTVGVVSAKGRKINSTGSDTYEDYIQTDAAINPGNSGGPLLNIEGKAIGINAAIITSNPAYKGYMGIGLAIPINMVINIKDQLINTGKVTRGFAGIGMQDLTAEIAKALDLKISQGAIITRVVEDSPADKAGLKDQDIIIRINGKDIESSQDVRNFIGFTSPGEEVTIVVNRDGREKKIKLTVGTKPQDEVIIEKIGLQVENKKNGRGVDITEVDPKSAAAQIGLTSGMTILAVNRSRVDSVEEFMEELKKAEGNDSVALYVQTDRYTYYITLPLKE